MTPEQRRKNRKTGLLIFLVVAAVFVWFIYRQAMLVNPT